MSKIRGILATIGSIAIAGSSLAQQPPPAPDDAQILKLYEGLRVADVADGMDIAGLRNVGLVDTTIQALWKDIDEMAHQIRGIAVTARYVPHNLVVPNPMTPEEFAEWEGKWYGEISTEPFVPLIRPGTVIVIDASGDGDTGSIGSYNSLDWFSRGAIGIVTSGSVRDTDEIIKQKIPLYVDPLQRGRGIRPGRNMIESVNQPVQIGGALVRPGDVVVADGDGVVVVPREHAVAVARAARTILDNDKAGRRNLYEKLGRPLDKTVRP
ncbi:MAG TPA: RraA family protein [Thermoanaerobaculia bacterium]|nr:RraA family protein [Thermoanaerobaculia bacterium]